MTNVIGSSIIFLLFLTLSWKEVSSIECYQCVSTDLNHPFQCNEYLSDDIDIAPQSCDNVYGASYCVKHTGRFEGQICLEKNIIKCYQCASNNNTDCSDMLVHMYGGTVRPRDCSHIYGASFCIKTTGRYGGGIGTKRFCSSLDLGNYCNYIQQPGDELLFRSCVYTCDSDGCNGSSAVTVSIVGLIISFITYVLL